MAEQLSQNNALATLQEEIRKELHEYANHVDGGGCKHFPDYTHDTGVIKGLAIAERLLLDLDKRIEEG